MAQLYHQPLEYGDITRPGQPLLRWRWKRPMVESAMSFAMKEVTVDSNGVHYTPVTAGFPSGPPVTLKLGDYLDLGYDHTLRSQWRETVRRDQKVTAARQAGKRGRFEWRVPFPAPAPVRRFIGDEGSLRINGSHTATLGGKSQWTAGEVRTRAGGPSKFPSLSMEQESKFSVEGSVGEAINIRIDQDTQQLGQGIAAGFKDKLANEIKLDYKGDEDDIFQEIVAGNTTLALPQTRFVTFNQQHKGLFGIRAKGRLGPMAFTTIASHEKSESNRRTFRGGAQVDTFSVRDHDYIRNSYFFLGMRYRDRLGDFREVASSQPRGLVQADIIDEASLEVYINDFNTNNDAELLAKQGVATVDAQDAQLAAAGGSDIECFDASGGPIDRTGCREEGTWHRLDPDNDYSLVREFGFIILNRPVQDRYALAVKYRTVGGEEFGAGGDQLRLRLIKARNARPDFPTWNLEWKNVYRIVRGFSRGRQFERDKIRVEILEEVPGREPSPSQGRKSLLQIMGLDTHGQDAGTPPDQLIDADYIGLDESRGVLIFPDLTPFAPSDTRFAGLENPVPKIYDSHQRRDQEEVSRFLIQVVNSSGEQRISLTQGRLAGIDTESVQVRLNGKRLTRDVDYTVSFTGDVTFLGDVQNIVSDPGAELEISYESQDLLGLGSQQKTLLGTRGEYEFMGGDATVGGTVLYNNVRSVDPRVRVGAEPARTVVWDLDLKAKFDAPLLTRAVDALPLLKTAARSDLSFHAEVAQSRPNLNTKGRGYIDDFEGSEQPDILSIFRNRWTPASRPLAFDADHRGRMIWYNPYNRIARTEIWPRQEEQIEASQNKTDVLVMELTPLEEGPESWGGLMSTWSTGVRDFSQSKFLEVWVRGTEGVLHIDLGSIDEDWIENGVIDTEDIPYAGSRTGDNVVSPEEDVGIDRRDDAAELAFYLADAGVGTEGLSVDEMRARFRDLPQYEDRDPSDPEGDNWHYDSSRNRNDYSRINGTEGNRNTEAGTRPDTEDLNNDGILNRSNDYYHHVIDLSDGGHVPGSESPAGWRLYRRRLFDERVERVGSPDSSRVEYGRLTLAGGFPAPGETAIKVEIAQIEIIRNNWQEQEISVLPGGMPLEADSEESFNVTVIGTDKSLTYKPPPGVKVRRLRNSRAREREQSLVLEYGDLEAGHQAMATKVLPGKADYTKYTRLKMFAHGDSTGNYLVDVDSSEIELFVRFGRDGSNFYEFATPIFPGWDERNEVEVDLLQMAQLKALLEEGRTDDLGNPVAEIDTVIADPDLRDGTPATYRVRGSPSMQQIRQLAIGVRNRSALRSYSGRLFTDELRLDEARNDPGLAAYARVNSSLADLVNVDASVDWQGENFRTITNTGRKQSDFRTSLNTTTNLHKFLPGSWGFSIPVKATYTRDQSLPRFGPNSDVELDPLEKQEQKSQRIKELYEISISKRSSKNWITRWSFDQMNFRMSQTRERGFSPIRPLENRDNQNMSFSYKMPLPKPTLRFLGWLPGFAPESWSKTELRFLPTTANYSMTVNRRESATLQRSNIDTTFQQEFGMRETYTAKANPIKALSGDYSLQINRDLRKKYDLGKLSFGREVRRNQKADIKLTLRFLKWLDQSYTFLANYEEISDPRRRQSKAVIDSVTGLPAKTIDITTKNNLSGRVNLRLGQLMKAVGKPGVKRSRSSRRDREGEANENSPETGSPRTDGPRQPFFLRRFLYFAGGRVDPLSANWRRSGEGRNYNLLGRPAVSYQLGLADSLEIRRAAAGLTRQDQHSLNQNLDLSTGAKLPMGFSVKTNYKDQTSRRSGSTRNRLRIRREETFPSVTVSWGRADRIPYVRRFLNSAKVTASIDGGVTDEGNNTLLPQDLLSEETTDEMRLSWTGQWRWGPSTRIGVTRSSSDETNYELTAENAEAGGRPPVRGRGTSERSSTSLEVKYRLRPRELPLLGKLKSEVDLAFEIERGAKKRWSATGLEEPVPLESKDEWKAELKGTYRFSDTFRGNGLVRMDYSRDNRRAQLRKVHEVKVSGMLTFR